MLIRGIPTLTIAGTEVSPLFRSAPLSFVIRDRCFLIEPAAPNGGNAAGDDEIFAARAGDLKDLRDHVLDALAPAAPAGGGNGAERAIYAAEDLTPSRFLETDWTRFRGAVLKAGSPAGHVALLARARGTPLVVGLGDAFERLFDGALAVLDGDAGRLIVEPGPKTLGASAVRQQDRRRVASRSRARWWATGPPRWRWPAARSR